jgi:aspartyl-tRNA(Asn)/glutamyl-tRNA(Gln) amidotransferase subunit A
VQAGPDDRDRTSLPPPTVRYEEAIEALATEGLRARWSPDLGFVPEVHPEVLEQARAAAEVLAGAAGLELDEEPVDLPDATAVWLQSGVLGGWVLEDMRELWPARAEELMPNTRRGFESSEQATAAKIGRIHLRRFRFEEAAARIFDEVDVLLTPSTAVPAFAAEGPPPGGAMSTPFTMLANLANNPATSIPCGFTSDGLPIGLQVVARRHADELCLRLARILEVEHPWPRTTGAA